MQRLHRDVDAVAVEILEHQELAVLARHLHGLQSHVAPDAVFLVHHRRAGVQVLQIAQDGFGIGGGALAAPFLAGARAEELRLGNHGDGRRREREPFKVRRDGERKSRGAGCELLPALDRQ